ncbi:MAG: CCA tRNA nucleotidyltransferase [Pseudomonadota bacterium]
MTKTPDFTWLEEPRLQAIISALKTSGDARFVGGCVRDGLLGQTPFNNDAIDIDIAVTLTPDDMKRVFDEAGIRWIATGEEHGTLTAVHQGLVVECTTLRADIDTDGRRAKVRFTEDWDQDWRRRDFTINALYADQSGTIYDPAGGQADLAQGRVRFIGDAATRIREDALRILRFFRFSARFAKTFDQTALHAIHSCQDLMDGLSRERVWLELSRTFSAPRAPEAFELAKDLGVLERIVEGEAQTDDFARLPDSARLNSALSVASLWPRRSPEMLRRAFKPSADFLETYANIEKAAVKLAQGTSAIRLLYDFGRTISLMAADLQDARGQKISDAQRQDLATLSIPKLPISGKNLISRGVQPGPNLGELMTRFEERWLDAGAPSEPSVVDALLSDVLSGQTAR